MDFSRVASPRTLVPALALVAGLATATPARGASCIHGYALCLVEASDFPTWWERSSAGIDCYLDTIACLKRAYG